MKFTTFKTDKSLPAVFLVLNYVLLEGKVPQNTGRNWVKLIGKNGEEVLMTLQKGTEATDALQLGEILDLPVYKIKVVSREVEEVIFSERINS